MPVRTIATIEADHFESESIWMGNDIRDTEGRDHRFYLVPECLGPFVSLGNCHPEQGHKKCAAANFLPEEVGGDLRTGRQSACTVIIVCCSASGGPHDSRFLRFFHLQATTSPAPSIGVGNCPLFRSWKRFTPICRANLTSRRTPCA